MKLKEQIHAQVKLLGCSFNTEATYWHWMNSFFDIQREKMGTHPKEKWLKRT